MTALGAFWSLDGSESCRDAVKKILQSQKVYAKQPPRFLETENLCLGRALWPSVPEDKFDLGPLIGGGGRWALSADVRLDARDELCETLGLGAERWKLSDAMIVLRAIERWGEGAVPRIIGDFALIIWDRDRERLILARDFQGRRPLHYHKSAKFIAVSGMPKGLHSLADIPKEPDLASVAEFLALLPEQTSKSFYAGVERVLPGEIVVLARDRMDRRRFWNFEPRPLRLHEDEYIEAVREVFERAVSARLRGSEGLVGAHLSGGLDSTSVAATAARLMAPEGKVVAFTAAPQLGDGSRPFTGRFNDESSHAAAVADLYSNMEHVILRDNGESPLAALEGNFFLYDRPFLNLCNGVWLTQILSSLRERGLKVLLTGEFGNVTISYSGLESLPEWLVAGRFIWVAREIAKLKKNGVRFRASLSHTIGPFLPRKLWLAINRAFGRSLDLADYSAIRPELIAKLVSEAETRDTDTSCRPFRTSLGLRQWVLSLIDDGNFLKGFLGGWNVDVRDPTVDRRVVELCLSIPGEQYLRKGQPRSIARRSFADRLPDVVLKETRKGYQGAGWHTALRAAWSDAISETSRIGESTVAARVLDSSRMSRLLDTDKAIDWDSFEAETQYRLALLRGLSAGHFLRRASGAN